MSERKAYRSFTRSGPFMMKGVQDACFFLVRLSRTSRSCAYHMSLILEWSSKRKEICDYLYRSVHSRMCWLDTGDHFQGSHDFSDR